MKESTRRHKEMAAECRWTRDLSHCITHDAYWGPGFDGCDRALERHSLTDDCWCGPTTEHVPAAQP